MTVFRLWFTTDRDRQKMHLPVGKDGDAVVVREVKAVAVSADGTAKAVDPEEFTYEPPTGFTRGWP